MQSDEAPLYYVFLERDARDVGGISAKDVSCPPVRSSHVFGFKQEQGQWSDKCTRLPHTHPNRYTRGDRTCSCQVVCVHPNQYIRENCTLLVAANLFVFTRSEAAPHPNRFSNEETIPRYFPVPRDLPFFARTARFPLEVEDGQGGVFSVDWTEGSSRYQADRVFSALDGTVLRLEVTEIGTEDAEVFLPMEKF